MKKLKWLAMLAAMLMIGGTALAQRPDVERVAKNQWILDDIGLWFGSLPDAVLEYDTAQTKDSLALGLSADSNVFMIVEKADLNTDLISATETDPTLYIHSEDATAANEWIKINHDGTNGVIDVGTGAVSVPDGISGPISATSPLEVISTDPGNVGATILTWHDSVSPAANDVAGLWSMYGEDDASNQTNYANILGSITNPADGSEEAMIAFQVASAGAISPTNLNYTFRHSGFYATREEDGVDGMNFALTQLSASPAAFDNVGIMDFNGKDSGGTDVETYAEMRGIIQDPTDGGEFGWMEIRTANGTGSLATTATFGHTGSSGYMSVGDGAASGVVSSNGSQNLIFATGDPTTSELELRHGAGGGIRATMADTASFFTIYLADDGTNGPLFALQHDSATPANDDKPAGIGVIANDDGGNPEIFSSIEVIALNVADGSENGRLNISTASTAAGGGGASVAGFYHSALGFAYLSVGTSSGNGYIQSEGNYDLILQTGNTTTSKLTFTDGASGDITADLDASAEFVMYNDDAGGTGSILNLYQDSASPIGNDVVGIIKFDGEDDASNQTTYGHMRTILGSPVDGAEVGTIVFSVADGTGALTEALTVYHDGTDGIAMAGDSNSQGVFQSVGDYPVVVRTGNATTTSFTIDDGANGNVDFDMDGTAYFNINNSEDGATGAILRLYQDSATPATSDNVGVIAFVGEDDASNVTNYVTVQGQIFGAGDGNELGGIAVKAANGLGSDGLLFQSVETDHGAHLIVGSGSAQATVTSNGAYDLYLNTGAANSSEIQIVDGVNGDVIIAPDGTGALDLTEKDINNVGDVNVDSISEDTAGVDYYDVDIWELTEADLAAGACTAGTARLDTGGATRELCICNSGGTAYDCWSVTTANGPTD